MGNFGQTRGGVGKSDVLEGGAENAGRENDGREIDGPICRA